MTRMDKLELLDTCTDGSVEKFHQLLQGSYDHLNILFDLCKDSIAPEHIKTVVFSTDDTESTFNVVCVSKTDAISIPDNLVNNGVKIRPCTEGFIVNISTNN